MSIRNMLITSLVALIINACREDRPILIIRHIGQVEGQPATVTPSTIPTPVIGQVTPSDIDIRPTQRTTPHVINVSPTITFNPTITVGSEAISDGGTTITVQVRCEPGQCTITP